MLKAAETIKIVISGLSPAEREDCEKNTAGLTCASWWFNQKNQAFYVVLPCRTSFFAAKVGWFFQRDQPEKIWTIRSGGSDPSIEIPKNHLGRNGGVHPDHPGNSKWILDDLDNDSSLALPNHCHDVMYIKYTASGTWEIPSQGIPAEHRPRMA